MNDTPVNGRELQFHTLYYHLAEFCMPSNDSRLQDVSAQRTREAEMCRRPSTARSLRARSAACSRPLCARFFARTNDLFLSQFSRFFFLLDIDKSNPKRNETQNQLRNYSTTTLNLNDANLQPSSIRKVFANN